VPAATAVARRGRVQSLMWAGGARGDKDSLAGVLLLAAELRTSLSTGLPGGSQMDSTTFAYEWERLEAILPAGRELLHVVARLAPGLPFPQAALREGGDCLPGPLEGVCAKAATLRATCSGLRDRGLLVLDGDSVVMEEGIRVHVIDQVVPERDAYWTATVLRFLTYALRADTHHSASWEEWRLGYPHVLAVCDASERAQVRLGDVAYLLDRASVYVRESIEDADLATALAVRAVTLSTELGAADPELHGDCLGNLALAHRAAGRLQEAVTVSGRCLEHLAGTLGEDTVTYAESLNIHGNLLEACGRPRPAEEAHARAVDILRSAYADAPSDEVRGILVEVLNDHAAELLSPRRGGRRTTGERLRAGRALLDEASHLLRRGEYGWTQVELNLARACRAAGEPHVARERLEAVRDHCLERGTGPSITLIDALASLAEVYEELGDPRAEETLREAHRVDNALAESLPRPGREGRTQ
jgi:Tetratricopeptide repeat